MTWVVGVSRSMKALKAPVRNSNDINSEFNFLPPRVSTAHHTNNMNKQTAQRPTRTRGGGITRMTI